MALAGHTRRLGTARDKRVTHSNPGYGVGIHVLQRDKKELINKNFKQIKVLGVKLFELKIQNTTSHKMMLKFLKCQKKNTKQ